jgi:hypothetical protein
MLPSLRTALAAACAAASVAVAARPAAAVAHAPHASAVAATLDAMVDGAASASAARRGARSVKAARSAKAARAAKGARAARASRARTARRATSRATSRSAARAKSASARRTRARRATRDDFRLPSLATMAPVLAPAARSAGAPAAPLTLRGSPVAVEQAYLVARANGLPFTASRREVLREAGEGTFVRLDDSRDVRLRGVAMPFARPATASFVASFGARYRRACGEPLTVTSALRPTSVRLANSSELSVHPTGMAVDLRVPRDGCRGWMRRALLTLERDGVVQATEERHPAHFHVVVLDAP